MAVSLEIRIRHLLAELLAYALVFLAALQAAGAISAGAGKALFYHPDHFLVFIQPNSHGFTSLLFVIINILFPLSIETETFHFST